MARYSNALTALGRELDPDILSPVKDDADLERRTALLLDLSGEIERTKDCNHPLIALTDQIAALIEAYEDEHYPTPGSAPRARPR